MPNLVRGAPLGVTPAESGIRVVGCPPGGSMRVLVLGDEFVGVWMHWVDTPGDAKKGRSHLCTDHEGDCPYHEHRRLWAGFIAALEMERKQRIVWRVGEETAKEVLRRCGSTISLRGAHLGVELARTQHGMKVIVDVLYGVRETMVPQPHPIEKPLCDVFGVQRIPDYAPGAREATLRLESDENGGVS